MVRSRRQRSSYRTLILTGCAAALIAGGGWLYFRPGSKPAASSPGTLPGGGSASPTPSTAKPLPAANKTVAAADTARPEPKATPSPAPASRPNAGEPELAAQEQVVVPAEPTTRPISPPSTTQPAVDRPMATQPSAEDPTAGRASDTTRTGHRAIEAARKLLDSGQVIDARHQLNSLLKGSLSETESTEVRALLTRIADDTIFGRRGTANDPLIDNYAVQAGDNLTNIGRSHDVPYEAVMEVNGISDPTKIRQDQKLRVPRGPFHAKIYKSKFRMDVYLQELYVRSYRVGLGNENGTPEGLWKVKNRLPNPTYYPPASAGEKRIIPPDDPTNPLGEHWIGLEGVEGDAVGHDGYGIHGTIDPESVGKAVSLGCIRMHNEDVAFVYKLLTPGRSTVTILP